MKVKKEYLILALVIVALSAYLYMRKEDRSLYELPVLPEVAKNKVSKIEISHGDTRIVLNKKDENWYIAPPDYLADKALVDAMLAEIESLKVTTLVSESKDYQRYDLGDDKKITVKAWSSDTLLRDFAVGKSAQSFRHTFVKLADDDGVYHASNDFRNTFDKTEDDLRDKSVLSFKAAEITDFQVTTEKAAVDFTHKALAEDETPAQGDQPAEPAKKVWQRADGKIGDDQQISRLLAALSNLRCDTFVNDRKKEDFSNPVYTIELKGIQNHRLSVFAKLNSDDKTYPAVSSGSDYAFLISENMADRIMKSPEDLVTKAKSE